jgi:hypothetical protein
MKKIAYIFRGPPASGKGTITELLIKELKGKTALLELDTFRWGFHYINRKIADIPDEEHAFAYQNLLLLLENYCKNGQYNLVVEGLFSWNPDCPHGNIQDILRIMKRHNFDTRIFLLSGDFSTLWDRNLKREYSVPEDEFKELYNFVMKETRPEETVISVNGKSPQEILDEIQKYMPHDNRKEF